MSAPRPTTDAIHRMMPTSSSTLPIPRMTISRSGVIWLAAATPLGATPDGAPMPAVLPPTPNTATRLASHSHLCFQARRQACAMMSP
ncbi:MAG: hypothetical protein M5R40_26670 [Anaerolineae bacterium]|nr:hypothetical protein [Anaerolineae bacterium]